MLPVLVREPLGDGVPVSLPVPLAVPDCVSDALPVGVSVADALAVRVPLGDAVHVGLPVSLGVPVELGVEVAVAFAEPLPVCELVSKLDGVGGGSAGGRQGRATAAGEVSAAGTAA